jgi:hypothetical protein
MIEIGVGMTQEWLGAGAAIDDVGGKNPLSPALLLYL